MSHVEDYHDVIVIIALLLNGLKQVGLFGRLQGRVAAT
jgi:hypothetical protein